MKQVVLTVVQDNEAAWKLYQKAGFEITESFLEGDGQMAYRMIAKLA
ncbi:MAG: hypothetical protein HQ557_12260 [Bacteroidetes bacterium]|nr:hypothetical protein [Bacteroidota bacterium]